MKKFIAILAVAVLAMTASYNANALSDQNPAGTVTVGLKCGFFPGIGGNITADYVLVDSWWKGHFTVGGFAGYRYRTYNHGTLLGLTEYDWHENAFSFAPRATYGLNITDKFEVHAGAMAGVYFYKDIYGDKKNPASKSTAVGFDYATFLGCQFFFNNAFGVTAEAGYFTAMPYLNAGLVFRF